MNKKRTTTRTLLLCLLGLTWGIGLTIAAVPLYRVFCQHFGIPVPKIVAGPAPQAHPNTENRVPNTDREITVRYTANVQGGLPVTFGPTTYTHKVKLGEPVLTAYQATNKGPAFNGVAVHMLYAMGGEGGFEPSSYIDLQQCFCFESEHYPAGQHITLPLSFTVSPNLPEGVHTITFAYTLFKSTENDPRVRKQPEVAHAETR